MLPFVCGCRAHFPGADPTASSPPGGFAAYRVGRWSDKTGCQQISWRVFFIKFGNVLIVCGMSRDNTMSRPSEPGRWRSSCTRISPCECRAARAQGSGIASTWSRASPLEWVHCMPTSSVNCGQKAAGCARSWCWPRRSFLPDLAMEIPGTFHRWFSHWTWGFREDASGVTVPVIYIIMYLSIYLSVYIYTIIYIGMYPYYDPYPHLIVLKSWTFVWLCSIVFSVAMGQSMSKPWFFAPEHTKINSIRSLPSIFASNLPEIDTKIQASCPWRLCGFPAAGGREHFLNSRISRKYDDGGFDDIMHRATVVIHYIRLFVKSICSFKLNGCSSFSLCMTCWIG